MLVDRAAVDVLVDDANVVVMDALVDDVANAEVVVLPVAVDVAASVAEVSADTTVVLPPDVDMLVGTVILNVAVDAPVVVVLEIDDLLVEAAADDVIVEVETVDALVDTVTVDAAVDESVAGVADNVDMLAD